MFLFSSALLMTAPHPPRFRFELFWLNQAGFRDAVAAKWTAARNSPHRPMSVVDSWQFCAKLAANL